MIHRTRHSDARRIATTALLFSLCGCNAPSGGGGGGRTDQAPADPLPEIQLGQQGGEQLDADIAAITQADNEAVECIGDSVRFDEEETLLLLKNAYVNEPDSQQTFEEFIASTAVVERSKADQICNAEPGRDEALDGFVQRLTDAENRQRQCTGIETQATTEQGLTQVLLAFFLGGRNVTDLNAFAEEQALRGETNSAEACAAAETGAP